MVVSPGNLLPTRYCKLQLARANPPLLQASQAVPSLPHTCPSIHIQTPILDSAFNKRRLWAGVPREEEESQCDKEKILKQKILQGLVR